MARQTLDDLLNQYEPRLAAAFRAAIREISSQASIKEIEAALIAGDIARAIDAMYVEPAAFAQFETVIAEGYGAGGTNTSQNLGQLRDAEGTRFVFRFDVRNHEAERWLREHSTNLVSGIVQEQRQIIRRHMEEGMAAGRNPRSVALDITGRINKVTGQREGGIIGLSDPQERAVVNARNDLEEGNYSRYFSRDRRDRRFDKLVARAARDGELLPKDQITKITNRYSDRLLNLRAETIARTEMLGSLHAAQNEALRQLVSTGKVRADQIKRVWKATRDARTRDSHRGANDQVVGLNEPFVMPTGARLMHPGDPSGPPEEIVNCRCTVTTRIDYLSGLR